MTSLAVMAFVPIEEYRAKAVRGAGWLLEQEGRKITLLARMLYRIIPGLQVNRIDPDLTGWPWASGASGWVEPTSHALVALKMLRPHLSPDQARQRILDGELMLLDRMCEGGGWNYGNSRVLGELLEPYPDTTAWALIALQDHPADAAIGASLNALRSMLDVNASGLALALSVLCFKLYGLPTADLEDRVAERFRTHRFLGETRSTALAVLALDDQPHFKVSRRA